MNLRKKSIKPRQVDFSEDEKYNFVRLIIYKGNRYYEVVNEIFPYSFPLNAAFACDWSNA